MLKEQKVDLKTTNWNILLLVLTIALLSVTIVLAIMFLPKLFLVLGVGGPATFISAFVLLLAWSPKMIGPAKVQIQAEP